jgi:hypothetical protein
MVGLRKAGMPEDYAVLCEFVDFRGNGQHRQGVTWSKSRIGDLANHAGELF